MYLTGEEGRGASQVENALAVNCEAASNSRATCGPGYLAQNSYWPGELTNSDYCVACPIGAHRLCTS